MKPVIEDFPSLSVSRLRAAGVIRPADTTAVVAFPAGPSFVVALQHIHFPNGGGWSFAVCSCGRRGRTLRLYENALACHGCLLARGIRPRAQLLSKLGRASRRVFALRALLEGPPARLAPRPGRTVDRRGRLEAALARAEFVALGKKWR
jgi:hypothetical protein